MTWIIENIESPEAILQEWITEIQNTIWLWEKYLNIALEYLSWLWPKLVWAILILWIWFKIIWFLNKAISKAIDKTKLDPMIKTFSTSFISIILKILVFLSAAWVLWIQTTSFIALFTAAWVAVGMSLSGTLQNFAWWIIILAFRLYKIWDFVSIWWNEWTVKSIHIFHTIILTLDRKTLIIPNAQISNWIMINFSTEKERRLDVSVNISYDSDIDFVKEIFIKMLEKDERILTWEKFSTNVFINEFRENWILITLRFFVKSSDLMKTKWDIYENIIKTCKQNNINIPFPIREVYIQNKKD